MSPKRQKTLYAPKLVISGIAIGVVLAITGSVGALNGWFGGGGSVPSDTLTRGLVGYWGFEEGTGGVAYDSSDYANTGTLTLGPTWTKGKVGGALSFDGSNDYVDAGNAASLDITDAITIEVWFKSEISGSGDYILKKGAGVTERQYGINWESDKITFRIRNSGDTNWITATSDSTLADNNWHHVVGKYDKTRTYLYIDGVLQANFTVYTDTINSGTQNLTIGYDATIATSYFNGLIDEVRIYNRALSAEEVRYHYNRGGPVGHWKFDEGEGRTAYDSTDNNNDGTLVLAPSGNTATSSAWVSGKYGSALSFDGVDDYVDAGNVSSNARTISFWLKRGDTSNKDVIDLGTPEIKIASNAITSTGLTSPTYYVDAIPNTTAVSSANQWYYVTITATANISASNVDIGKASSNYFLGLIDDVRIYNYARTPEEIRLDYNAGFAAHFGPKSDCKRDPGSCMTQGLVGYWGMDEGNGAIAYDNSDYDNDGALTSGPSWTKGKVGGALSFDGVNDSVNVLDAPSLDITDALTIEAWVYANSFKAASYDTIVQKRRAADPNQGTAYSLATNWNDNELRFFVDTVTIGDSLTSNTQLQTGRWYHVAVTYNSSGTTVIYLNGILDKTSTLLSGSINVSPDNLFIGTRDGNSMFWNGTIDEVRIYNRALFVEEIRYHYNRGGPVAQWKFDEGEGRTAYDSTDNNNDGTLVLAPSGNTATSSAWVSGKFGSALNFDGVDDFVDGGNVSSNARTISFWLKRGDTSDKDVIDLGTPEIKIASNAITSTGLTSPTYYVDAIAGNTAIADTNWHFVSITDIANINANNVDIGKASSNYFNGLIDDVRIYNYARTPEEIRLDYNSGFAARFGPSPDCKTNPGSCITQGLVGYWGMDEGSGALAADASDYANHGTLTSGPSWTKGKVGGALSFDGTNDYVIFPNSNSLQNFTNVSVEVWVKPYVLGDGFWREIISKGHFQSANDRFTMYVNSTGNQINFTWHSGATDVGTAVLGLSANTWYHIVATYDGHTLRLYKDGAFYTSTVGNGDIASWSNTNDLYLAGTANELNGLLDEVRIYNRALSPEEVRYHYNRGGPVAQWKFDEGEGRTAYDSTDNNNDGTLVLVGSATSSAWVAGKYGSALSFDGVDDYVSVADSNSLDITTALTIGAWVKLDQTPTNQPGSSNGAYIIYKESSYSFWFDSGETTSGSPCAVNANQLWFDLWGWNGVSTISSTVWSVGTWYYVVGTYDGSIAKIYVDGVLNNTCSFSKSIGTTANNLFIGDGETLGQNPFAGQFDDVRIYNYARTPSQILQDYNSGLGTHFR